LVTWQPRILSKLNLSSVFSKPRDSDFFGACGKKVLCVNDKVKKTFELMKEKPRVALYRIMMVCHPFFPPPEIDVIKAIL
jgi:hypothetical protein